MSVASAHPGPAGHTHPDEWPFEMLVLFWGAILAVGLFKLAWKKG